MVALMIAETIPVPKWIPIRGSNQSPMNAPTMPMTISPTRALVLRGLAGRRKYRALRSDAINVFHVHNDNRVIAFHRWVEGAGEDVVVVVSLREQTWYSYEIGFPADGSWREVFNSDVYDNWVNPMVAGNGGSIVASGPPRHGMPCSATIVIPANAILEFAR
jgi:1,4-alpha-glucan branching enzyme